MTWASERFRDYLIGLRFEMQTDHKPLVSLLGSKNIDELPVRIQRFRMRLMRFDYSVMHVPGKDLNTADTLSRLPDLKTDSAAVDLQNEVEAFVDLTYLLQRRSCKKLHVNKTMTLSANKQRSTVPANGRENLT